MSVNSTPDEVLRNTFIAALLITGSPERGEAAVSHALESATIDSVDETDLLLKTIAAALEYTRQLPLPSPHQRQMAATMLCSRLLSVLLLPVQYRQCFVLRILAAMPNVICADLLLLTPSDIDAKAGLAAQFLAQRMDAKAPSGFSPGATYQFVLDLVDGKDVEWRTLAAPDYLR